MKRYRLYFFACTALIVGWLGYGLAGGWLVHRVAVRFGGVLLRVGQGKFNDPSVFVHHRLREVFLLATLALLWIGAHSLLDLVIRVRTWAPRWRWAAHSLAGFALLNVWIAAASETALFWAALGAGAGVHNYMQFQFKRAVAAEIQVPMRAVLVGSSQTQAQIDEDLLNGRLGTNLWTTELHFPGSKAYDLLLIEPQLERARPQLVVCYLTEGYFYGGSQGKTAQNFLTFAQLPDAWRRGALHYLPSESVAYGLLGNALPLFRCRGIVSQRLLGFAAANLSQAEYDASLAVDLEARARERAKAFRPNAESEFQKRAFEDFVVRCEKANREVILLTGGYNPILMRQMDPVVREDMLRFLDGLKSRHANVMVIPASELPEQKSADYNDLNHVNRDMQQRFTAHLTTLLTQHLQGQSH